MLETISLWLMPSLLIVIAGSLLNVWVVRFSRATQYRGAGAHSMKEEFAVYGLPEWFMYTVGALKIGIACVMMLVLFQSDLMMKLGVPALGLLTVLMLGAISMHVKVKDSFVKSVPALLMLGMALGALYLAYN